MKKLFLSAVTLVMFFVSVAQVDKIGASNTDGGQVKNVNKFDTSGKQKNSQVQTTAIVEKGKGGAVTSVKNQSITGTCWCFSATSLVESQCIKKNLGEFDISEMYTVRNIYVEKAHNYILRQGHTQFGQGGLGHDLIRAIATYGAVPENVYSGLLAGNTSHNHVKLADYLKNYLDSILKITPVPSDWSRGYVHILDSMLGASPVDFVYNGKKFTPKSFATEVLKFNPDEYVNITSFTHHPYYEPFIIEVPDNFSNGAYYNLPLNEMIQLTKDVISSGYTVLWDADVSNSGFMQERAIAYQMDSGLQIKTKGELNTVSMNEIKWDAAKRQKLYENLTTQDDHLMHITGMEKKANGKTLFSVKNSWGDIGPLHGYINVTEAYFAINTISLIIPKAAIPKTLLEKLKIR